MNTKRSVQSSVGTSADKGYEKLKPNVIRNLVNSISHANSDISELPDRKNSHSIRVCKCDEKLSHELFAHNTFDIIYAACDPATVTVSSQEIQLDRKGILFIAPGVPYRVSVSAGSIIPVILIEKNLFNTHFYQISKFDGMLSRFFAHSMWGEYTASHIIYNRVTNNNIHALLNMLINDEISGISSSVEIKTSLLLAVFGYLCALSPSYYEISAMRITRSGQIAKILTYIQENYRTVTLEKLAENFHYTVPYVSKLIRSVTGLTFTDILREIRFDVCRSLLLNSDLKINKIAEIAGFQNTDHFNRMFKKRMGETPTDYKKDKTHAGIDK